MENEMYSYLSSYLTAEEIEGLRKEMAEPVPHKGFVANLSRLSEDIIKDEFPGISQDSEDEILFRYDPTVLTPGKSILHEGGAFYIMDPSAAEATSFLGHGQKENVIDLCAAPGGKTISYALRNPDSIVFANDYSRPRAEELSKNVERLGLANVIVTSLEPAFFLQRFSGFFDKVILDAPCSGTGMFRKEEKMEEDWSPEKTERLTRIQDALLKIGAALLKPGGEMIYITCSFLEAEDEDRLRPFLAASPDLSLVPLKIKPSYREGSLKNTVHLLPSLFAGEGHFFALLKKAGEKETAVLQLPRSASFDASLGLYVCDYSQEKWALPRLSSAWLTLPAIRFGLKLTDHAEYAKNETDHALSHYQRAGRRKEVSREEAIRFLRGEELKPAAETEDGLYLISYRGLGLGFGLKKGSRIRNLYPKGLRRSL
jgi:16S rRNA C967 or C1407 C5-methylase (RsmB/RsmF family)/NOL1/NOP2/fmu family ribosome biogenesis protein